MNCIIFTNVMNNITIINASNCDNSNIAKNKTIPTSHGNHKNRILKFKPLIKIPIVINYKFFSVFTFSKINCFT